jgi:hypothetical protein
MLIVNGALTYVDSKWSTTAIPSDTPVSSKNVMLYMFFQVKVTIVTTLSRTKWDKLTLNLNLGVIDLFGYE